MQDQSQAQLMMSKSNYSFFVSITTLIKKEIWRFMKIPMQTILAPVSTSLLFIFIMSLAIGEFSQNTGGVNYLTFIAPGLIMMSIIQNAFSNSAFSILISKVQGNIVDVLMPPFTPTELNIGIAFGGVVRGVVVGVSALVFMFPFVDLTISNIWAFLYFLISGSMMMALFGNIVGLWSEKFDHMQSIVNFVVTPLAFLSGTFYSIEKLPPILQTVSQYNPFFYAIDGFRYGFIGTSDSNIMVGAIYLGLLNLSLFILSEYLFRIGYRIKS